MDFEVTETPLNRDLEFLTQKINDEAADNGRAYNFAIFVRHNGGEMVAGCNGSVVFGSVYTDQLWVHEDYRRKGLGTQLMDKVHEYGKSKGCTLATVTTMSFQAPLFYEKLGYKIDYCRGGYSRKSTCIFMSKLI